jgi:hypothetical protein
MAGGDSVFYAPRVIIRNSDPWSCSDTSNGPVLSMMIRKKPGGWFIFQDRNTDSIKFKSNAVLNESWICRTLPDNGRLMAKVTEEWGIPLAQNCQVLLDAGVTKFPATVSIKINPNPVSTLSVIDIGQVFSSSGSVFYLFDTMGRIVKNGSFKGKTFVFNRSGISAGYYLLRIKHDNGGFAGQIKLMID